MINYQIQTKIKGKDVKVAQMSDIPEKTSNREIIVLIHELRCYIRFLESDLQKQWEKEVIDLGK